MSWDHGYYSQASYTSGYYREMAPSWIDFAALVKGVAPGRHHPGATFRYLDLGCGTGFGLCLLASLYPEGQFVGVDFLPLHVAQAEALASSLGLENVRFREADFLTLANDSTPLAIAAGASLRFDYVVAHGVATWVVEPVQHALFATAASCLRPGGLFYCSYNCFPGWLSRTALHQLVGVERLRSDPAEPFRPIRTAAETLAALLGEADQPTTLAQSYPGLRQDLAQLDTLNPQYLSQEYANEGWQPLYVDQLHKRCREQKLTYLASANLSELFPQLLPQRLQEVVTREPNPSVRELLADLATCKSFRRDIFARGPVALTGGDREERLATLQVRLQEAPPLDTYVFPTSYGDVAGRREAYQAIEAALADGPRCLGALLQVWPQEPEDLLVQVALLLNSGRIGMDRGSFGAAALKSCQRVNRHVEDLTLQGAAYAHLAAPLIGQAIAVPLQQQMIANGIAQGLGGELLATCVQAGLNSLGVEVVRSTEGKPITEPEEQLQLLQEAADQFRIERLPHLQALGVYPT